MWQTITLSGPVGKRRSAYGGNKLEDRVAVFGSLIAVGAENGGTPGLAAYDEASLVPAIETFQKRWWPGRIPDGYFDRNGSGIQKINALLGTSEPSARGAAPANGKKKFAVAQKHLMHQGSSWWASQKISSSKDLTIHAKGCLLTAIACGFSYKGVTIPLADQAAVKDMILRKNFAYPLKDYISINPATLDAWASLNAEQGYGASTKFNIDPGRLKALHNRRDLTFYGTHKDPAPAKWLELPTTAQMARWVDEEWMLIVRRWSHPNHYLWVIGYEGDDFLLHDVGYSPSNVEYCGKAPVHEFDQVLRWGPA